MAPRGIRETVLASGLAGAAAAVTPSRTWRPATRFRPRITTPPPGRTPVATRGAIQTPRHHTATQPSPRGDPRRDSDHASPHRRPAEPAWRPATRFRPHVTTPPPGRTRVATRGAIQTPAGQFVEWQPGHQRSPHPREHQTHTHAGPATSDAHGSPDRQRQPHTCGDRVTPASSRQPPANTDRRRVTPPSRATAAGAHATSLRALPPTLHGRPTTARRQRPGGRRVRNHRPADKTAAVMPSCHTPLSQPGRDSSTAQPERSSCHTPLPQPDRDNAPAQPERSSWRVSLFRRCREGGE
jgi:hypothetical protein